MSKSYPTRKKAQRVVDRRNAKLDAVNDESRAEATRVLAMFRLDESKFWPDIAHHMWAHLRTLGYFRIVKDHSQRYTQEVRYLYAFGRWDVESELDEDDNERAPYTLYLDRTGDVLTRWSNQRSPELMAFVEQEFDIDCALHKQLWSYLYARLPTLAEMAAE